MKNVEIQAQVCLTDTRYYFFQVIIIFINRIHCKLPRKISIAAARSVKTSLTNCQPLCFWQRHYLLISQ